MIKQDEKGYAILLEDQIPSDHKPYRHSPDGRDSSFLRDFFKANKALVNLEHSLQKNKEKAVIIQNKNGLEKGNNCDFIIVCSGYSSDHPSHRTISTCRVLPEKPVICAPSSAQPGHRL